MQATKKQTKMIQWMCVTAILTAANVVMSSFSIPVPGGHLYLNDVVICTAAILLDSLAAFFVGGVGAFLGDLLFYPLPMFVSLASHGLEAVAISLIARYLFPRKWYGAALGVTVGAVIMVTGYSLGRAFVYATPATAWIKLPFEILQAGVGAVSGVVLCFPCGLAKRFDKMLPALAAPQKHKGDADAVPIIAEEVGAPSAPGEDERGDTHSPWIGGNR